MTRHRRSLVVAALILVAALGGLLYRHALWRAAYPYLPPRAQALPYRLQAYLPAARATPVALPTPAPEAPREGGRAGVAAGETGVDAAATETAALGTVVVPRATQILASGRAETAGRDPDPIETPGGAPVVRPTGTGIRLAAPRSLGSATRPLPSETPPPAAALPATVALSGLRHEYQTWNNCGPATISMALSVLGAAGSQAEAARVLKPDPDDKNVAPDELAAYARSRGYGAVVRVNGTVDGLRSLLAAGFPVIVETWFIPEPGDEMGHYRLLTGYDDGAGVLVAADSYHGPNLRLPVADFDPLWRVFNRSFVVVFPLERASEVDALLGPARDDPAMFAAAAERARAELDAGPDAFGWFNLGSSLVGLGDMPAAAEAFDQARSLGLPWRMLWYQFGPFEAYAATARWSEVEALAQANLANADNLEESNYWLGRVRQASGDAEGARRAWQRALELNPNAAYVRSALDALP